ncbi:hypothetical protein C8Q80DRAFT_401253 [Daedaleopsis nitida]|nr:hypothetical protein C8Q80DRAFT_401253 [Daedaleopsis nitida]
MLVSKGAGRTLVLVALAVVAGWETRRAGLGGAEKRGGIPDVHSDWLLTYSPREDAVAAADAHRPERGDRAAVACEHPPLVLSATTKARKSAANAPSPRSAHARAQGATMS